MSPATQQLLITVPSAVKTAGIASVPRCQNFIGASLVPKGMNERIANLICHPIRSNTNGDLAGLDDYTVTYQVTKALYDGLLSPVNAELPPVKPSCSTGNCTWDVYQSLAVCGSTADVTDQLSDIWAIVPAAANTPAPLLTIGDFPTEVNVTGFFLPNGAGILNSTLNLTSNEPALLPASTPSNNGQQYPTHIDSLAFPNVAQPLGNFFVIFTVPAPAGGSDIPDGLPLAQVAFECILQLCVQSYNTTTVDGVSSTKVTSSFINNTYGAGNWANIALAGIHGQNLPYNSDKNASNIYAANMDAILAL
jgi:hypothetical protein